MIFKGEQLTEKEIAKLERWKAWGESMGILRAIHEEIQPQLDKTRELENIGVNRAACSTLD